MDIIFESNQFEQYQDFITKYRDGDYIRDNKNGLLNIRYHISPKRNNSEIYDEDICEVVKSINVCIRESINYSAIRAIVNAYKIDCLSSSIYKNLDGEFIVYYPYILMTSEDMGVIMTKIVGMFQEVKLSFDIFPNYDTDVLDFKTWNHHIYYNKDANIVEFGNVALDEALDFSKDSGGVLEDFLFFNNSYFNHQTFLNSNHSTNSSNSNSIKISKRDVNLTRFRKYMEMLRDIRLTESQVIYIVKALVNTIGRNMCKEDIIDECRDILAEYGFYERLISFKGLMFSEIVTRIISNPNYYTYRTIRYMASTMNSDAYLEHIDSQIIDRIRDIPLSKSAMGVYDIARLIYPYVRNSYCSVMNLSGKSTILHRFDRQDGIWKNGDSYQMLKRVEISKFRDKLKSDDFKMSVAREKDSESIFLKLRAIDVALGKSRTSIANEISDFVVDANFDFKDEGSRNLMNFGGRCVDFTFDSYYERLSMPEDFLIKMSYYRFRNHYTFDDPNIIKFLKYMRQMWKYKPYMEYMLKVIAIAFLSRNMEQIFAWITGSGDNSKTAFKTLLEDIFGEYYHTVDCDAFFSKSGSGPNPQLAFMDRVKLMCLFEPSAGFTIPDNVFKIMTGCEKFFARFCNRNGKLIKPSATSIAFANEVPKIRGGISAAIIKRQRICPTQGIFIRENAIDSQVAVPKTSQAQWDKGVFKLETKFINELKDLVEPAIWVLVQYCQKYLKEGIETPDIVKRSTEQYYMDSDGAYFFLSKNIIKVCETDAKIHISKLYSDYMDWCEKNKTKQVLERGSFIYMIKTRYNRGNEFENNCEYIYGYKNAYAETYKRNANMSHHFSQDSDDSEDSDDSNDSIIMDDSSDSDEVL